jgi:hypothetical protein
LEALASLIGNHGFSIYVGKTIQLIEARKGMVDGVILKEGFE